MSDKQETVMVAIPRSALTVVAPPPASVSQRTCLDAFGLPPKTYLALARAGAFPVAVVGRLRVAAYDDVRLCLAARSRVLARVTRAEVPDAAPASEDDELAAMLARSGAKAAG